MRNHFEADFTTIRDRLSKVNWIPKLHGDFKTGYIEFCNILEEATEGCIPQYRKSTKRKNIYLTPEAIRKKDLKNKLWRRYKKSKCGYDRTRYIRIKNELRTMTRTLRLQCEYNIAQDVKNSPKKFWSYVNSKTKVRSKIPNLRKADGTEATTAIAKAEILNKFFSSIFTTEMLVDSLVNHDTPFLGDYLNSFTITPEMVRDKLHDLNPEKSPGPDGWHPILLKYTSDLINFLLSVLLQKSLNEGMVSPKWLEACITATHKNGKKNIF